MNRYSNYVSLKRSGRAAATITRPTYTDAHPPAEQSADEAAHSGRAAAWLGKQVEIALVEVNLSISQYRALAVLSEGSAISSTMAKRLAVRPPSVSSVMDGLVARNLVERRHNDDDRRIVSHQLTAEGQQALALADQAADRRLEDLAAHLESTAETRRAFAGLRLWLQAMATHYAKQRAAR